MKKEEKNFEINEICKHCMENCKQLYTAIVVRCPLFIRNFESINDIKLERKIKKIEKKKNMKLGFLRMLLSIFGF